MNKTVVIGMSGGVDSSVAAWLLKEQGYHVIGVTMQIWKEETPKSAGEDGCGITALDDAKKVADQLGIPHYVINFREEFKDKVISNFIEEYLQGRTPNPCIVCNRYIKWQALLTRAKEFGADYIATGHYARIKQLDNGRYTVCKAVMDHKDQTYALYELTQEQLAHTLMPVGNYDKNQVREIAEKIGLSVANKPDSQEICFIPDNNYVGFIEESLQKGKNGCSRCTDCAALKPGNFVLQDGTVLGKHKGIVHYTVGQRKGLGIAFGKPMFVLEIRPETNEVVLGPSEETLQTIVKANHLNFMGVDGFEEVHCFAKIRYNHRGEWCTVKRTGEDEITCTFDQPVRAAAPGQALVLYHEDYVLGGGTII